MDSLERARRKALVFHVMYGTFPSATDEEMYGWRKMCAEYINGTRDSAPATLEEYRQVAHGM
jgi:hypothetical protein